MHENLQFKSEIVCESLKSNIHETCHKLIFFSKMAQKTHHGVFETFFQEITNAQRMPGREEMAWY